jgi:glycosyltransferase involved in cell wall biosynthesis
MEAELMDHVDGVVATSLALTHKAGRGLPVLHLPQGVDFDHFNARSAPAAAIADMEGLRQPIVGFFGTVGSWVDLKVLEALSKDFPEASFVVIGPVEVPDDELPRADNIHFIGPISYARLPAYARYFDVGLIPFVDDQLTRAVNPLKLYEYFALGLPVLATKLPELERAGGPVFLAADAAEFTLQLKRILSRGPAELKEESLCAASRNTWSQRAGVLSSFIESLESVSYRTAASMDQQAAR